MHVNNAARTRTSFRHLCVYLGLSITIGWNAITVAQAAQISVSASQSQVTNGSTFSIFFSITGLSLAPNDSLSGFDLDVLFNPGFASFVGASFIDPTTGVNQLDLTESGSLGFFGDASVSGGVVDAFGLSGNSSAFLDAHQAAGFRFLALSFLATAPTPALSFAINLVDPNLLFVDSSGNVLPVTFQSSSVPVAITPPSAVPEPGMLWLAVAGVVAFVASGRRRTVSASYA